MYDLIMSGFNFFLNNQVFQYLSIFYFCHAKQGYTVRREVGTQQSNHFCQIGLFDIVF